jgi:hypothetical protein
LIPSRQGRGYARAVSREHERIDPILGFPDPRRSGSGFYLGVVEPPEF